MQVSEKLRPLFVRWQFPDSKVWICMESVLLRAIPARTLRYLGKEKPSETGGLLWGAIILDGDKKLFLISQADFVSSETETFNGSPTDLLALLAALGRPKPDLKPIGYFRSSMFPETEFREQEKVFFERSLQGADAVFLLVVPLGNGRCAARFFLRKDGRLEKSKYLEVPLQPVSSEACEELALCEEPEGVLTSEAKPHRPVVSATATESLSRLDETPDDTQELDRGDSDRRDYGSPGKESTLGQYAAVAAVAAILGFSAYALRSQLFPLRMGENRASDSNSLESKTLDSTIALQVSRRADGQLDLAWNKALPALRSARSAVLSIKDGYFSREIQLGADQLRSGRLVYFPEGSDIQFHLEVFVDSMRSIGESVRVISHDTYSSVYGNTLPPIDPSRLPKAPLRTAGPAVAMTARPTISNTSQPVPTSASKENAPSGVAVALSPKPPENNVPQEEPPPVQLQQKVIPRDTLPLNQVSLPVSSKASGASDTASNSIPATTSLQSRNEAPVKSETAVRTIAIPATQTPLRTEPPRTVNTPPSASTPHPVVSDQILSSPPQPLKKVAPNTRPFGTSLITSDADLDVLVNVDETGKVIEAHVVNSAAHLHSLLTAEALEAARRWKFEPAQRGGAKVPGTYLIQFRFRSPK